MLDAEATVQPLREWSQEVVHRRARRQPDILIPHFDPAESGVDTQVLVLMEAPGPMTVVDEQNKRPGSGFISIDNSDGTAENCWRLRDEVGLVTGALHWNIVPWYLGPASRKPSAQELGQGALELRSLLPLLPQLRVVLTCGLHAQNGWRQHVAPFVKTDITVVDTWHPSPLAMKQPGKRDALKRAFERAASFTG